MRVRTIFTLWLPLAVSFELMMLEGPTVQAAMGRLPDPKLSLAAWGLTISLSLLIESPVIMLLATAIALVQDGDSYRALRQFMLNLVVGCTVLTALVAFTPLLEFVAGPIMGQPEPIIRATRPAMQIMLLWSAAIAWRRFYQGIMVRYGQTRRVSWGTAIRLVVTVSVAMTLAAWQRLPGAQVGAWALMAAVITEALATTVFALPIVRRELLDKEKYKAKSEAQDGVPDTERTLKQGADPIPPKLGVRGRDQGANEAFLNDDVFLQEDYAVPVSDDFLSVEQPTSGASASSAATSNVSASGSLSSSDNPPSTPPPTYHSQRAIWKFHAPLAATTLLTLLAQPITAAALARLPHQVATLAVWPVVSMLLLVMRGWGLALQEITVSQAKDPASWPALKRFTWIVGVTTTLVTAIIAFSPLLDLYLGNVLQLPPDLYGYAHIGVGAGLLLPLVSSLSAWAGGLLVASGQTQHRYRGMGLNLATHGGLLAVGVMLQWPGMWVAAGAFTVAAFAEYAYLAYQAKRT